MPRQAESRLTRSGLGHRVEMKAGVVTIDQEYARECCRLARLTEDQRIQERLLEMAREWMTAAMQGIAWPGAGEYPAQAPDGQEGDKTS
jgi:hypothetical protein